MNLELPGLSPVLFSLYDKTFSLMKKNKFMEIFYDFLIYSTLNLYIWPFSAILLISEHIFLLSFCILVHEPGKTI